GIEQRDTEIKRLMHQCDRFALGKISPPTGGNRPQTKANFAHRQVSILVRAKAHGVKVKRSTSKAQHPTPRLKSARQIARRAAIRDQTAAQLRILYRATADISLIASHLTGFLNAGSTRGQYERLNYSSRLRLAFRIPSVLHRAFSARARHHLLAWRRFGRACILEWGTAARRTLRCRSKENSVWQQSRLS